MLAPYSIAVERDQSLKPPSLNVSFDRESMLPRRLEALNEVLPLQGLVPNSMCLSVLVQLFNSVNRRVFFIRHSALSSLKLTASSPCRTNEAEAGDPQEDIHPQINSLLDHIVA
jgi:hypothetical protein